jgi:hypothetical protein
MNERIRQLAEQAGWDYSKVERRNQTEHFDEAKFAELIVRECAEQIKTHNISASSEGYGDYEIGFNAGLFHALRTTKEHFGVEE